MVSRFSNCLVDYISLLVILRVVGQSSNACLIA